MMQVIGAPLSRMGWQCPRCNKCYSPDVTSCTACTGLINPHPFNPTKPTGPVFPQPLQPYTLRSSGSVTGSSNNVVWNTNCTYLLQEDGREHG